MGRIQVPIFIATTTRKRAHDNVQKSTVLDITQQIYNWRVRKPNYQRRVKDVLQGVMNTVSKTSGKAVLSQIL